MWMAVTPAAAAAARGVQRSGPTSTSTPNVSIRRAEAAAISAIAPSNASALRRQLAVAADLADVLAGGRLQFARRRRLIGAPQVLMLRHMPVRYVTRLSSAGDCSGGGRQALGMLVHPEGGWYAETWRAAAPDGERSVGSAILYLLAAGDRSHWHRLDADEVWQFSGGDPLALRVWSPGDPAITIHRLGGKITGGSVVQAVVPADAWQTAYSLGAWTRRLRRDPAFEFDWFELAAPEGHRSRAIPSPGQFRPNDGRGPTGVGVARSGRHGRRRPNLNCGSIDVDAHARSTSTVRSTSGARRPVARPRRPTIPVGARAWRASRTPAGPATVAITNRDGTVHAEAVTGRQCASMPCPTPGPRRPGAVPGHPSSGSWPTLPGRPYPRTAGIDALAPAILELRKAMEARRAGLAGRVRSRRPPVRWRLRLPPDAAVLAGLPHRVHRSASSSAGEPHRASPLGPHGSRDRRPPLTDAYAR
jgi:predicted cupin superfamily sugar epimerase